MSGDDFDDGKCMSKTIEINILLNGKSMVYKCVSIVICHNEIRIGDQSKLSLDNMQKFINTLSTYSPHPNLKYL